MHERAYATSYYSEGIKEIAKASPNTVGASALIGASALKGTQWFALCKVAAHTPPAASWVAKKTSLNKVSSFYDTVMKSNIMNSDRAKLLFLPFSLGKQSISKIAGRDIGELLALPQLSLPDGGDYCLPLAVSVTLLEVAQAGAQQAVMSYPMWSNGLFYLGGAVIGRQIIGSHHEDVPLGAALIAMSIYGMGGSLAQSAAVSFSNNAKKHFGKNMKPLPNKPQIRFGQSLPLVVGTIISVAPVIRDLLLYFDVKKLKSLEFELHKSMITPATALATFGGYAIASYALGEIDPSQYIPEQLTCYATAAISGGLCCWLLDEQYRETTDEWFPDYYDYGGPHIIKYIPAIAYGFGAAMYSATEGTFHGLAVLSGSLAGAGIVFAGLQLSDMLITEDSMGALIAFPTMAALIALPATALLNYQADNIKDTEFYKNNEGMVSSILSSAEIAVSTSAMILTIEVIAAMINSITSGHTESDPLLRILTNHPWLTTMIALASVVGANSLNAYYSSTETVPENLYRTGNNLLQSFILPISWLTED